MLFCAQQRRTEEKAAQLVRAADEEAHWRARVARLLQLAEAARLQRHATRAPA